MTDAVELASTAQTARLIIDRLFAEVATVGEQLAAAEMRAQKAEAKATRLATRLKALPKADANLLIAAWTLIDRLETITTEQFRRGGEHPEREALRELLDTRASLDPELAVDTLPDIADRRISPATARQLAANVRNLRYHEHEIHEELLDRLIVACESLAHQLTMKEARWRMRPAHRRLRRLAAQMTRSNAAHAQRLAWSGAGLVDPPPYVRLSPAGYTPIDTAQPTKVAPPAQKKRKKGAATA